MVVDDPLSPFLTMSLGPFLPELCTSFPPSCYRYAGLAKLWQGLYCFIYMKIQSTSQAAGRILIPRNLSTAFLPCLALCSKARQCAVVSGGSYTQPYRIVTTLLLLISLLASDLSSQSPSFISSSPSISTYKEASTQCINVTVVL